MSDAGTMYANAKALHELLQESRAENEKLRELLREVLDDAWSKDYYTPYSWLEEELRKIGVEV